MVHFILVTNIQVCLSTNGISCRLNNTKIIIIHSESFWFFFLIAFCHFLSWQIMDFSKETPNVGGVWLSLYIVLWVFDMWALLFGVIFVDQLQALLAMLVRDMISNHTIFFYFIWLDNKCDTLYLYLDHWARVYVGAITTLWRTRLPFQ